MTRLKQPDVIDQLSNSPAEQGMPGDVCISPHQSIVRARVIAETRSQLSLNSTVHMFGEFLKIQYPGAL